MLTSHCCHTRKIFHINTCHCTASIWSVFKYRCIQEKSVARWIYTCLFEWNMFVVSQQMDSSFNSDSQVETFVRPVVHSDDYKWSINICHICFWKIQQNIFLTRLSNLRKLVVVSIISSEARQCSDLLGSAPRGGECCGVWSRARVPPPHDSAPALFSSPDHQIPQFMTRSIITQSTPDITWCTVVFPGPELLIIRQLLIRAVIVEHCSSCKNHKTVLDDHHGQCIAMFVM